MALILNFLIELITAFSYQLSKAINLTTGTSTMLNRQLFTKIETFQDIIYRRLVIIILSHPHR